MTISLQTLFQPQSRLMPTTQSVRSEAVQTSRSDAGAAMSNIFGQEEDVFDISKLAYLKSERSESEDEGLQQDPKLARWTNQKNQAREQLERLIKELKLVKKMWAHDPEELAKQLLRLGEMIKETVDLYKEAQKEMAAILKEQSGLGGINMSGLSAGAMVTPRASAASPPSEDASEEAVEADAEIDAATSHVPKEEIASDADVKAAENLEDDAGEPPDANAQNGLNAYKKQAFKTIRLSDTPFAGELHSDLEFANGARQFVSKLRLELEAAHKKSTNMPGDRDEKDKFFKEADEQLEDLESDLFKFVGDLQKAMPPGIRVQVPVDVAPDVKPSMPAVSMAMA